MIFKLKNIARYSTLILAISALFLGYQTASAQTTLPSNAKNLCAFSQSDFYTDPKSESAKNSFITLGLPPATQKTYIGPFFDSQSGMVYVFPPQGPSFASSSNCEFFKWAAQMFLWSTSTVHDDGKVPTNIAAPSSSSPYVFNSEFFYRFSGRKLIPQTADGTSNQKKSSMLLRSTKENDAASGDGVGQAGGDGVLLSQGKNAVSNKSSLVYYGVHTSRVYGYTAAAKLQGIAGDEFPSDGTSVCEAITFGIIEGYTQVTEISWYAFSLFCLPSKNTTKAVKFDTKKSFASATKSAQQSSVGIPELEPAIDYLAMTVELKTSWIEADSVVNKADYIIQKEKVPTYTQEKHKNGTLYWKKTGEAVKELAMVGMHVVGTVKGHPEMIWATIEHINNAPDATYSYIKSDGSTATHTPVYSKSTSGANSTWLFADGTDSNQNNEFAKVCEKGKLDICANEKGEAIGASNVVRSHPWGVTFSTGKTPADSAANKAAATISSELISLNTNIMAQLNNYNQTNGITSDPRVNYYVSGANWGVNGHIPTGFDPASANIAGSAYLANTTMETFEQDKGCFSCHSAGSATQKFSTSHIFDSVTSVVKSAKK